MNRVAFLGNYVPRRCGIATFTTDLCESFSAMYPSVGASAVAMTDRAEGYAYPARVQIDIQEQDVSSYLRAAHFLNLSGADVVSLQHEFGIFGGTAGSHIIALLDQLQAPVVTTLHTVLRDPSRVYRQVLIDVASRSERLVVMSATAVDYLVEVYGIRRDKIDVIPHGIPNVPFDDPRRLILKRRFGVEGKTTMMTFGLLSPNKGIEHVIQAMPAIASRYPNTVYIVLGETHPNVKAHSGEAYRESLLALVRDTNMEDHVQFLDRFVSLEELVEYIDATDLYVTPYKSPDQIVSGTLAYAFGAGKAVISTPYVYAKELLADERGLLVPFGESAPIAEAVIGLLDDPAGSFAMRQRAYSRGREMTWPRVVEQYAATMTKAIESYARQPMKLLATAIPMALPEPNLDHLFRMTDDTGLLQHAVGTVPNYDEGYTTDDNVRALALAIALDARSGGGDRTAQALAERYLAFTWHAFNKETGRFRNFMGYDRLWLESVGSEDSQGRVIEVLATLIDHASTYDRWQSLRPVAARLFKEALPAASSLQAPRAWAHVIVGLDRYLRSSIDDQPTSLVLEHLAERLAARFKASSQTNWLWCEAALTYENALLPRALLVAGARLGRPALINSGLAAMAWLCRVQRPDEKHFVPVGSDSAYKRRGPRPRYDQQPIEALATVSACLAAFSLTGNTAWREEAEIAFRWFLGANDLGAPVYDAASGGCHDGLQPDSLNQNQGAESLLAFQQALLELQSASFPVLPDDQLVAPIAIAPVLSGVPGKRGL